MSTITINQAITNAHYLASAYNLSIGDVLVRTYGVVEHYAVFVGYQHGVLAVAENQLGFGVRVISLHQFLNEGNLKRVRKFHGNPHIVLSNINIVAQRRASYDLIFNNCEHFANEVITGEASSNQVRNGLGIAAGLVALFFAPRLFTALMA